MTKSSKPGFKIYGDADSLPNVIKELLFRAAERLHIPLILIASKKLATPASEYISSEIVPIGADSADHRIVELVQSGDLVISADIPLADRIVKKDGVVIDPRGMIYTKENVKERLSVRDLMHDLRAGGIATSGPKPFDPKTRKTFASQLDRYLTKRLAG